MGKRNFAARVGLGGVVGLLLLIEAPGCTRVNRPLNRSDIALENRVHNQTRAAMFVGAATTRPIGGEEAIAPARARSGSGARKAPAVAVGASAGQGGQGSADRLPHDDDGYFIGVAISGGGSRSANFSASCLFQLQRIGLLQHVDYMSSVSGGSLTAAYYCLSGTEWNPGNVQKRLSHSFASDIIVNTFMPWTLFAFTFTDWDRSDLLAVALRDALFTRDGKAMTFADLRADRPRLLINATDLQSGRRFVFSNESFDELNSDLGKYPIHYAVAASASFPVVFHQVTLQDYSTVFKQYRHLIDGGVSDNLGVETLLETYQAQTESARRLGQANPYPHGAILIVIDARTHFDAQLGDKGDIGLLESLKASMGLTSTALLARAGSATLSDIIVRHSPDDVTARDLRQQIHQLQEEGYLAIRDRDGQPVRVVHLALGAGRPAAQPAVPELFREPQQHRDVLQHRPDRGLQPRSSGEAADGAAV